MTPRKGSNPSTCSSTYCTVTQTNGNVILLYSRDCDRDGYFYVGGCWVKKDWRGRIVRRLKKPITPPHVKSEWFLNLRMKFANMWMDYGEG